MIVLEPAKRISLEDLAVELGVRAPQPQTPRKSRFTIRVVPQEEIITFKPKTPSPPKPKTPSPPKPKTPSPPKTKAPQQEKVDLK